MSHRSPSYSITIRLRYPDESGQLGTVSSAIGEEDGLTASIPSSWCREPCRSVGDGDADGGGLRTDTQGASLRHSRRDHRRRGDVDEDDVDLGLDKHFGYSDLEYRLEFVADGKHNEIVLTARARWF